MLAALQYKWKHFWSQGGQRNWEHSSGLHRAFQLWLCGRRQHSVVESHTTTGSSDTNKIMLHLMVRGLLWRKVCITDNYTYLLLMPELPLLQFTWIWGRTFQWVQPKMPPHSFGNSQQNVLVDDCLFFFSWSSGLNSLNIAVLAGWHQRCQIHLISGLSKTKIEQLFSTDSSVCLFISINELFSGTTENKWAKKPGWCTTLELLYTQQIGDSFYHQTPWVSIIFHLC